MSEASSGDPADHRLDAAFVIDTGPLLCFGGSLLLHALYVRHFAHTTTWVGAVAGELRRTGRIDDDWGRAAKSLQDYEPRWLPEPFLFPAEDEVELKPIREAIEQLAVEKSNRSGRTHVVKTHEGETQSVALAVRHGMRFVSNDFDAITYARSRSVTSGTVVTLSQLFVARGANATELAGELQRLANLRIGIGGTIRGALDLRR